MSSDDSNKVPSIAGMVDEPGRGLVPVTQTQELIRSFFDSVGGESLSNFDGDPKQKWRLTAIAQSKPAWEVDKSDSITFGIKYWYAHRVRVLQPNGGEYVDATRVVLMNDKLETIAFTSDGLAQSLAGLIQAYGMSPYVPAVAVRVEKIKTRLGRTTYQMVPAEA